MLQGASSARGDGGVACAAATAASDPRRRTCAEAARRSACSAERVGSTPYTVFGVSSSSTQSMVFAVFCAAPDPFLVFAKGVPVV